MNARQLRDQVRAASTSAGLYTLECPNTLTSRAQVLNDLLRIAYHLAAELDREAVAVAQEAR